MNDNIVVEWGICGPEITIDRTQLLNLLIKIKNLGGDLDTVINIITKEQKKNEN